ncbi:MAG: hypothetical protein AB8E82_01415 [Aureispira sp.]
MPDNKPQTLEQKLAQYITKIEEFTGLCIKNEGAVDQETQAEIEEVKRLLEQVKEERLKKKKQAKQNNTSYQDKLQQIQINTEKLKQRIAFFQSKNCLQKKAAIVLTNINKLESACVKIKDHINNEQNPLHNKIIGDLEKERQQLHEMRDLLESQTQEEGNKLLQQEQELLNLKNILGQLQDSVFEHIENNTISTHRAPLRDEAIKLREELIHKNEIFEKEFRSLIEACTTIIKKAEELVQKIETAPDQSFPEEFEQAFNTTQQALDALSTAIKNAVEQHQNDTAGLSKQLNDIKTALQQLEKLVGSYESEVYAITDRKLKVLEQQYEALKEQLSKFNTTEQQLDQRMQEILNAFGGDPLQLLEDLKKRWNNLQTPISNLLSKV